MDFTLLKKVFFIFSLFCSSIIYGYDWNIQIEKDYFIEITNFWNNEIVEIEISVESPQITTVFIGKLLIKSNEKKGLLFPHDFKKIGPAPLDSLNNYEFKITATSKKNKIASATFLYLPYKQSQMQPLPYARLSQEYEKLGIWGKIIDGYTWVDKNGENLVVRSSLLPIDTSRTSENQKMYLYCYHFTRNNNAEVWRLVRKVTDVSIGCHNMNTTVLNVNNIELTDLNQDTIAEFTTFYVLNCNASDSLLTKRALLLTNGQKYTSTSTYTKKQHQQKISVDASQKDPIIERYLKYVLLNKPKE